jgi:hypothetical protein
MTDPNGENRPDEEKEQQRRVIEDAMLAFRPEVVERFSGLIERDVPDPDQALENLAAVDLPRVLKHRLLIDALRRVRRTAPDEALDQPVRRVLGSTLDEAPSDSSQVDEAKRVLDDVAAAEGEPRLRPEYWAQWVRGTEDVFHFSTEERTFEACDDEQLVTKATTDNQLVRSRLIVAEFWSDQRPTAFSRYIDPSYWPQCSKFWQAMTELRRTKTPTGYDGDFRETVAILSETLTVPLQVAFRERPDGSRIWTRFNISRPYYMAAVPVDVDTGTVSAESMPGGPAPTLVRATKYLHWADPARPDFTMLACDFGWSELMVQMADACGAGFPAVTGPTTAETSVDDAVSRLVQDVTTECRDSLGDYGPSVERLIGRFTGQSWDPRWINDLLAMGMVTAVRYGRIASHVRRFADALKDADDREEHHA